MPGWWTLGSLITCGAHTNNSNDNVVALVEAVIPMLNHYHHLALNLCGETNLPTRDKWPSKAPSRSLSVALGERYLAMRRSPSKPRPDQPLPLQSSLHRERHSRPPRDSTVSALLSVHSHLVRKIKLVAYDTQLLLSGHQISCAMMLPS